MEVKLRGEDTAVTSDFQNNRGCRFLSAVFNQFYSDGRLTSYGGQRTGSVALLYGDRQTMFHTWIFPRVNFYVK